MNHISAEQFRQMAGGRLSEADYWRLEDHLDGCPDCAEQFDRMNLRDETFASQLQLAEASVNWAEPGCQRLLDRLTSGAAIESSYQESLPAKLPRRYGHYRVVRIIGVGGMGVVYEAEHEWLRRRVAIKTLRYGQADNPHWLRQFGREFRGLAHLDHPGIVRVIDAGREDAQAYFVMELIDGLNLFQIVHRVGALKVPAAAVIVCRVAEALQYAHGKGFVHRDIKPANIMLVRQDDGRGCVKLLDLGLAHYRWTEPDGASELTDAPTAIDGAHGGTLGYAAPEQIGGNVVDPGVDVYALGIVAMTLLTGQWPTSETASTRPGSAVVDLDRASETADWISASLQGLRDRDVDPDLVEILRSMLSHDPQSRPVDMTAIVKRWSSFCGEANLGDLLQSACEIGDADEQAGGWQVLTHHRMQSITVAQPMPRGRRWFRFRLPPTLLLIAAAGMLLGTGMIAWLPESGWSIHPIPATDPARSTEPALTTGDSNASRLHQARDVIGHAVDRRIAERTIAAGGFLDIAIANGNEPQIDSLTQIPPEPFTITWLMLEHTSVGDKFLNEIRGLSALRGITLTYTQVTDQGVKKLAEISTLRSVYLYQADVSDAGVRPIARRLPLDELVVSETGITDQTIHQLAGSETLERLAVKGTAITGDGIQQIGSIKSLTWLDVRETAVTDEDLAALINLSRLRILEVQRTAITPAGLRSLLGLPCLTDVRVSPRHFSEEVVDGLREEFPQITFFVDFDE